MIPTEEGVEALSTYTPSYRFRSPPLLKGKVTKQYLAICHGDPGFDSVVDAPLYRRSSGKVGAVNPWEAEDFKAKEARTRVRNVATAAGECLSVWCVRGD